MDGLMQMSLLILDSRCFERNEKGFYITSFVNHSYYLEREAVGIN
jgi:hypothetical protein